MYAVRTQEGRTRLLAKIPADAVESFEFDIKDLPAPPEGAEHFSLEVDFDAQTFRWIATYPEEPAVDPITQLEDALCDMDAAQDERLSAIEEALCELDELLNNGGTEDE